MKPTTWITAFIFIGLLCISSLFWVNSKTYLFIGGITLHQSDLSFSDRPLLRFYNWYVLRCSPNDESIIEKVKLPAKNKESDNEDVWIFSTLSETKTINWFTIGLKNKTLSEGRIKTVYFKLNSAKLNNPIPFKWNNKAYTLEFRGQRDYNKEKQINQVFGDMTAIRNYKLILSNSDSKQILTTDSLYIYNGFHEMYITDLDEDGIPDIISPVENSPSVYDVGLFLSSEAQGKDLVKLVAHHKPCGC